jgi:SAM-dependent methyltransferase
MPAAQRLTDETYWHEVHLAERGAKHRGEAPAGGGLRRRIKRLLGARRLESFRSYEDFLLWDVILPRYLSGRRGGSVVEVGSAPGERLIQLNRRFGLTPYGIEYSPVGVALNREVFADHGIDPGNVIEADFLAPDVHERYREAFDVVVSNGFIEHFTDVGAIVERHLGLLKPGGRLVVVIPNLLGVNFLLTWLFRRDVLPMHNLDIMRRGTFAALFDDRKLERLFCGYYGTFSFYLFHTAPGSLMRIPLAVGMKAQPALNALFRAAFKDRGAESGWFSPSLLYVGAKR